MPNPGLRFRAARPEDAHGVAMLHAESWQRHYRGAYSDAFLDGEVSEYLDRMWTERLAAPPPRACTILAENDGVIVGLAHTLLDDDPVWGALIDNLHVQYALKRQGVGSRLLALTARTVLQRSSSWSMYLWVLEQNTAAQAFYSARGGECVGHKDVKPPGGDLARLNGTPRGLRFAWRDAPPCGCGELHPGDEACQFPDEVDGYEDAGAPGR
jgi:ribosomal protein S18 acetylase RimI-like enzyme